MERSYKEEATKIMLITNGVMWDMGCKNFGMAMILLVGKMVDFIIARRNAAVQHSQLIVGMMMTFSHNTSHVMSVNRPLELGPPPLFVAMSHAKLKNVRDADAEVGADDVPPDS